MAWGAAIRWTQSTKHQHPSSREYPSTNINRGCGVVWSLRLDVSLVLGLGCWSFYLVASSIKKFSTKPFRIDFTRQKSMLRVP
jgi:hypothetical protein